jgi:hypothetical protein
MERRERRTLVMGNGDAITHQRPGHATAAPRRMHRNCGDRLRRDRPAAEELPDRQEQVPADDLPLHAREPERRVGCGGSEPAHVGCGISGERLGVYLGEATHVVLALAVANLDWGSVVLHERPSVLAAAAAP